MKLIGWLVTALGVTLIVSASLASIAGAQQASGGNAPVGVTTSSGGGGGGGSSSRAPAPTSVPEVGVATPTSINTAGNAPVSVAGAQATPAATAPVETAGAQAAPTANAPATVQPVQPAVPTAVDGLVPVQPTDAPRPPAPLQLPRTGNPDGGAYARPGSLADPGLILGVSGLVVVAAGLALLRVRKGWFQKAVRGWHK